MDYVINWGLIKHPVNWLTVILMVLIAGGNVVRFAPALIISEEEVNTGLDRFAKTCERFVSEVSS